MWLKSYDKNHDHYQHQHPQRMKKSWSQGNCSSTDVTMLTSGANVVVEEPLVVGISQSSNILYDISKAEKLLLINSYKKESTKQGQWALQQEADIQDYVLL